MLDRAADGSGKGEGRVLAYTRISLNPPCAYSVPAKAVDECSHDSIINLHDQLSCRIVVLHPI